MRGIDVYSSEDEKEESASEEENEGEHSFPCDGDLLMMRRVLKN